MRRLAVELSPPIDLLKVRVEAYFAITPSSLQFGGGLTITADVGIASGKAWILVDALFKWTPHIFFLFRIDAGIEIKDKLTGETFTGVTFRGELSGMTPWRLEGHATVTLFWKDIPFDLGPWEWGEKAPAPAVLISSVELAAQALSDPAAWRPQLPVGTDTLARFTEDTSTQLLVHPLGQLEIKQLRVPLETPIDRIGSNPVTSRYVHLDQPKFGTLPMQQVSHAKDHFAPGLFLNLSDDEQISRQHFEELPCGIRMAAAGGVAHGSAMPVAQVWETKYPHENFDEPEIGVVDFSKFAGLVIDNNSVSRAAREKVNPHLPPVPAPDPRPYAPREAGRVGIARRDDLSAIAGATEWMTTTAAAARMVELAPAHGGALQLVTSGIL